MFQVHPTLVSNRLVSTVNFYEDYFDFIPAVEKEGYALLTSRDDPDKRIAVVDSQHARLPSDIKPVQGLIINIAVRDVQACYDALYMEGLEIYKPLGEDIHGQKHFMLYDPNGVLVNVHEPLKLDS